MKTESNRRVNSRTQRMARNDFPLPSHPSPLPLVSQSDKPGADLGFAEGRG